MKIEKTKPSKDGEKEVAELCEKSFLKLWSYSNPYKQPGKELCDNLIIFDKTIIIISEKTKTPFEYDYSLNKDEDLTKPIGKRRIDTLWNRWSKELKSSEDQLNGAERWIKEHPDRIYLDPKCQQKFPITIPDIENFKIIKISVINGLDKVNKLREQSCNGELDYELPKDMILFQINLNNIIHLLDDYTFPIIMKELDTASDFINFFIKKEKLLKSGKTPFGVLDLDLLTIYLSNINFEKCCFSLGELENRFEEANFIIIDNPTDPYIDFIQEEHYKKLKEDIKLSYLWDSLIDNCSQDALDDILVEKQDINETNKILMIMASETRVSRKFLTESYLEIISKYDNKVHHLGRAMQSPSNKKIMYVFLQVAKQSDESYQNYRIHRRKLAELYCLAINANANNIEHVIAIVSEPVKYNKYLSRDFILYPCKELTPDEKNKIFKMQKELNILTVVSKNNSEKANNEVGRNDKCPCGSGLKYKKCCLRV